MWTREFGRRNGKWNDKNRVAMNPHRPRAAVKQIAMYSWLVCKRKGLPRDLRRLFVRNMSEYEWKAQNTGERQFQCSFCWAFLKNLRYKLFPELRQFVARADEKETYKLKAYHTSICYMQGADDAIIWIR
jgi:hypothetical protein